MKGKGYMMKDYRLESDSFGELNVPKDKSALLEAALALELVNEEDFKKWANPEDMI